ncbi:MAG: lysophospholipid acyltransferase family protein [Pseudanabaena sp. ELA607]|jgi:1-acyl-sn-glycerol-3-phosphate acyltransferase
MTPSTTETNAITNYRDRESWLSFTLYHALKWLFVSPVMHLFFGCKIYGSEHVPRKGKVIVVMNHASDFDPPMISNCVGRPVAFMAKEELFKNPVLAALIRLYGAYPVKRGAGDRAAIRAALEALSEGWATGVFLQGTRTPDGTITAPKLGAALIAAKSQALILPVSIWGTDQILPRDAKLPRFAPVTVRIGAPLNPPAAGDRAAMEALTQQCADIINQMHALGR